MAVFYPYSVKCVCGNPLTVHLAESINVKRSPELREKILSGEFHRAACASCGRKMTVEKPFYYTDLSRNSIFKVSPRGDRHQWKIESDELDRASSYIPETVTNGGNRTLRVIFGMDELREKLIAQDAGIDDRVLELLKVLLVYEHPILVRRSRLRLIMERVTVTDLEFCAMYEHSPQRYKLRMPKSITEHFEAQPGVLNKWVSRSHQVDLFQLPDNWVNMWRWSPQPNALALLKTCAEAIRHDQIIDTDSQQFRQMLTSLPRGSHLPSWAKRDLRTLFEYSKQHNLQDLEDELFEIRFGIELEDDWAFNNDPDDIDTLWKLLKDLPDTNVEGNTKIHEMLLDEGTDGGMYDSQSHDIAIGARGIRSRERFEDTVRHEVGHAVHEQNQREVDAWLENRFGWRTFQATDAGISDWVEAMGGWGPLSSSQQRDVSNALRTCIGSGGSWEPGPSPVLPSAHPWNGAGFGPRLAFEQSPRQWYEAFNNWYRTGNTAFFLNYWYRTFMAVDVASLKIVEKMPSNYASMSPFEFFAELYALHFDLNDPDRSAIPSDVSQWLNDHIGAPEINAPAVTSHT